MAPGVEIRALGEDADDLVLGERLVREYVAITAAEVAEPGDEPDLELFTALIPDATRFNDVYGDARAAFLVAEILDGSEPGVVGCVGIAPVDGATCEMKRLYVFEAWRGLGLGRRLAEAALATARSLGFTRMALDVVPHRVGAIALYRSMGFRDGPTIFERPFPMVPLEREL